MRNARDWPQQCLKSCRNGSNIVARRFETECWKLLAQKFDGFKLGPTKHNNTEQHEYFIKNHNQKSDTYRFRRGSQPSRNG